MINTLFLQARGCRFGCFEKQAGDVGNHRVCAWCIPGVNGRKYFVEFTGYDRKRVRTTHKVTGKPLKHRIIETDLSNALYCNTQFTDEYGQTWGDLTLEKELSALNLEYTRDGILKAAQYISGLDYTHLVIN